MLMKRPLKMWHLTESVRDVIFCQPDNSEGERHSPPPTTPSNTKTKQLFENKRQLTAICNRLDSITTQSVSGPQKQHRIGNILF